MKASEFREKIASGEFKIGKKGRIVEDYDAAIANLKRSKPDSVKPKKVRKEHSTAVPNTFDGIKFKSKLETYCYKWFKNSKLNFGYEPITFELQKKIELPFDIYTKTKSKPMYKRTGIIDNIEYTPDFIVFDDNKNIIAVVETKGRRNEQFPLKIKMFYDYAIKNIPTLKYYFEPTNEKEVDKMMIFLVSEILK